MNLKNVMNEAGERLVIDADKELDWKIKYLHVSGVPFEVTEEDKKLAEEMEEKKKKNAKEVRKVRAKKK